MKNYSSHVKTRNTQTPQTQEVAGKNQVQNNAGGFVFGLTPEQQFQRFLILGSEGGTYYVSEHKLTVDNAKNAIAFIKADGRRAVELIVAVSDAGRAPKNDPAIFALALACTYGDAATKQLAYAAIERVCRIGTHIFHFCQAIQDLRGWSRGLRKAVAKFYTSKSASDVAYQVVKYRQRDNWTHRDVLRLAHPKSADAMTQGIFRYAVGKEVNMASLPQVISAFEECKNGDVTKIVANIKKFNMSREMVPTEMLNNVSVWEALLEKMPPTALIRNLGKMTSLGILTGNNDWVKHVVAQLTNVETLKKARIHPLAALIALKTYAQGRGFKGDLTWRPVANIIDALDDTISKTFDIIEPSNKRYFLALDVSGSMGSPFGDSPVTCCEASAVMALVTAKAESDYTIMGFAGGKAGYYNGQTELTNLAITKKTAFLDAAKEAYRANFGTTDCALPITYALKNKMKVDVFCIYTDNETYAGTIHPFEALKRYRKEMGINAKLVVAGMTSTGFSIADPSDAGMLDVVGFDTTAPAVISEFSRQ